MSKQIPFDLLDAVIQGEVLLPGEDAFEEARQIWNSRLVKVPSAIVQCTGADDVAATIGFARLHRVPISVRSGGHSYAGLGVSEGDLMIDLSRMNEIRIDRSARRGQVGAGVKWGDFYEAAFEEGLTVAGGACTAVGVAGFTLGGGSGWLSRKYGLGLDNLLSVEIVTAEGKVLKASERNNSDLFWGVRGGAGNFGIVTQFEFQLHEACSTVYAGQIMYSLGDAEAVLKLYREEIPKTPAEFVCFPCAFRIPPIPAFGEELHGQVVLSLVFGYLGDPEEGERIARRFTGHKGMVVEAIGPSPYLALLRSFDAGVPSGQRWYTRSHYLAGFSDEVIKTFLEEVESLEGALTLAYFEVLDGAVSRVPSDATAFPHRDAPISLHILAGWMDPAEDERLMKWTRDFHEAMTPFSTGGVYVNLLAEDEPGRVEAAYGSNYERLTNLKAKWDPENFFRSNQNINPSE